MEKAAAAEFNTGGRSSRAATTSFDWGAREPASSIGYKS
jgi:hypothetical protein